MSNSEDFKVLSELLGDLASDLEDFKTFIALHGIRAGVADLSFEPDAVEMDLYPLALTAMTELVATIDRAIKITECLTDGVVQDIQVALTAAHARISTTLQAAPVNAEHLGHEAALRGLQEDFDWVGENYGFFFEHMSAQLTVGRASLLTESVQRVDPYAIDDKVWMASTDIAAKLDLNPEALRKRLDRWRRQNMDGWHEIDERSSTEPGYLFRFGSIRHVVIDMLASGKTSGTRPAQK